jgi:hypothetical protein
VERGAHFALADLEREAGVDQLAGVGIDAEVERGVDGEDDRHHQGRSQDEARAPVDRPHPTAAGAVDRLLEPVLH